MPGLLIILGMAVLLLLLPIILPVVAVLEVVDRHRRLRAAERYGCERCGRVLGREGLERGNAAWVESFAALQRAHPCAKLRVVRDVYAVCPDCGARYGYDETLRTFRLLRDP